MKDQTAEQVANTLRQLFPASVAAAVSDPQLLDTDLMPTEAPAIANARALRRTEFVAGRRAARRAMVALQIPPAPVPAGPDRAPVWPAGVIGSISHTYDICVAVVAAETAARSLGVDIEGATPLEADLLATVCAPTEAARIAGPDQLRLAKLIFSAKEAAYKAQYPLTQTLFGFDHFDVTLDLEMQTFIATFLQETGQFAKGDILKGRFDEVAGYFVTAVTIPNPVAG